MSQKPGDELDKDQETEVPKTTEVVDSEDDEVGNVNTICFLIICTKTNLNI